MRVILKKVLVLYFSYMSKDIYREKDGVYICIYLFFRFIDGQWSDQGQWKWRPMMLTGQYICSVVAIIYFHWETQWLHLRQYQCIMLCLKENKVSSLPYLVFSMIFIHKLHFLATIIYIIVFHFYDIYISTIFIDKKILNSIAIINDITRSFIFLIS